MSHLSPLLKPSSRIQADHGKGCYLYDEAGNSWLDFTSGIGVTGTGHCHPTVVEAVREQAGKLIHGQYTTISHDGMHTLTDRLYEKLPTSLDAIALFNSGSEAVEAGIRLARHATGRTNIIAFTGGFHGRTNAAAALTTSTTKVRTGFHPLMAGVCFSPFPHTYRYGWSEEETVAFCLRELDHLFLTQSTPADTAAMIIEPVQGEYGYYPATVAFMQGLRERCDRHGILLIADEIQAGYGRTGAFWSHSHFDIVPDILLTAKGLASGFPLSGMAASTALMGKGLPGSQGGTYGANAVSCAAALATLDVIEEESLVDNARQRGAHMLKQLHDLQQRHSCIDEIRGMGLMLGMEITNRERQPDGELAGKLVSAAEDEGLLLLRCGTHGQVVRWLPPLTVQNTEIDDAVRAFEGALTRAGA
ncbi:aspartate aminotransferase family protein [Isoalcanivorax indicus]|uniref:aspartate aminotransferase family protein n=1 Tax=Isoalcanivorax indicus TaxID=2202653 RepID=UPI000DB9ACB1|nr:aminotransferase class III-fold pyridoxal phosphate-dependent enzyme [Isoalcanivorax indicus]